MWYLYDEARGVLGQDRRQAVDQGGREVGRLHGVPHGEQHRSTGHQGPGRLGEGRRLVREKHDAELAHDHVKGCAREVQALRVCLKPGGATDPVRRPGHHRRVEVGGDDVGSGQGPGQLCRGDAGTGRELEHALREQRRG